MRSSFPISRLRRLRRTPGLRKLLRETRIEPSHLVAPLFVQTGTRKEEVPSMPGIFRLPIADAAREAQQLSRLGIGALLLFGVPSKKDPQGREAFSSQGIVQRAVKTIKQAAPDLVVMTDVCLCEYATHGHCGIVQNREVDNDATLSVLAKIAVSHSEAGADIVAPSAMMDGQVRTIRKALDKEKWNHVPIMSYSAKYASSLYGPFREAVDSTPQFGDRCGYQMDPPNVEEALREVALDIQEGADIVMVKPASLYLDVLKTVKEKFQWPTAAYQVSGEYSLIKAAALKGWIDEEKVVVETAIAMKRAGADLIITYYAKELAVWLSKRRSY